MAIKNNGLQQSKDWPTYDGNKFGANRRMDANNKEEQPSKEELLHDSFKLWIDKLIDKETRGVEKSIGGPSYNSYKSTTNYNTRSRARYVYKSQ